VSSPSPTPPKPLTKTLTAWALTPGSIGHEVQCIGVVEALGLAPVVKRVDPPPPFRWLAPWGPAAADPAIAPPWPDLLVVSGRQAIPYARMIRRRSAGRTLTVCLQNPVAPLSWFDLVWTNVHDGVAGPNVLTTLTSPNTLTRARLKQGAAALADRLGPMPRPWIGGVVGGASGAYAFSPEEATRLGAALAELAARTGGSVVVTPSRRTPPASLAALQAALAATLPAERRWVWDGASGDNPYFGILGGADVLVVTCDSVNMLGEAAYTGTSLYAFPLAGGTPKFAAFHAAMVAAGAMRWLDAAALAAAVTDGSLARWAYEPLNANGAIAARIATLLATRGHAVAAF
jgi:mitochondrial fission protein ELM1